MKPGDPIYENTPPLSFEEELLNLDDADMVIDLPSLEQYLGASDNKYCKLAVVALQLLQLCCQLRCDALQNLQQAHDELACLAAVGWKGTAADEESEESHFDPNDGPSSTVLQMWTLKAGHRAAEEAYHRFWHFDGLVGRARQKLRWCFQEARRKITEDETRRTAERQTKNLLSLLMMKNDAESIKLDLRMEQSEIMSNNSSASISPRRDSPRAMRLHATKSRKSRSSFGYSSMSSMATSREGSKKEEEASSKTQAALNTIIQVQAVARRMQTQRRYCKVMTAIRRRRESLLTGTFRTWKGMAKATRHNHKVVVGKAFAALLGYTNIKALRRLFASEKLATLRLKQTVKRCFIMWYRYAQYVQAPVDRRTGFRMRKFKSPFALWDQWALQDAENRKREEKAAKVNLGTQVLNFLRRWKSYTDYRRGKRDKIMIAQAHYSFGKLRRHFMAWVFVVTNKQQLLAQERASLCYYMKRWHQYIHLRRMKALCVRCIQKLCVTKFFTVWKRRADLCHMLRISGRFRLIFHRPLALYGIAVMGRDDLQASFLAKWFRWKQFIRRRRFWKAFVSQHWEHRMKQLLRTCIRAWSQFIQGSKHTRRKVFQIPPLVPVIDASKTALGLRDLQVSFTHQSKLQCIHNIGRELEMRRAVWQPGSRTSVTMEGTINDLNTELHGEVVVPDEDFLNRSVRLSRHHWQQWCALSDSGDPVLLAKVLVLLVDQYETKYGLGSGYGPVSWTKYSAFKMVNDDPILDPLLVPHSKRQEVTRKHPAKHDNSDDELTAEEQLAIERKDTKFALVERAKVLLASLGPPFFNPNTHRVDLPVCMAHLEEVRKRYYIINLVKHQRDKRIAGAFEGQMTAARIHSVCPSFTLPRYRNHTVFIMVQYLASFHRESQAKKKSRKGAASPQAPPTPSLEVSPEVALRKFRPKHLPLLTFLVLRNLPQIIDDRARYQIDGYIVKRLAVLRTVAAVEYQLTLLPGALDGIHQDIRVKRIHRMDRIQFMTAFQSTEATKQKFLKVSAAWKGDKAIQTKGHPGFSLLNLLGFNPALISKPMGAGSEVITVARMRAIEQQRKHLKVQRLVRMLETSGRKLERSSTPDLESGDTEGWGDIRQKERNLKTNRPRAAIRRWTICGGYDTVFGVERRLSHREAPSLELESNITGGVEGVPAAATEEMDDDEFEEELERELRRQAEQEAARMQRAREQAVYEARAASLSYARLKLQQEEKLDVEDEEDDGSPDEPEESKDSSRTAEEEARLKLEAVAASQRSKSRRTKKKGSSSKIQTKGSLTLLPLPRSPCHSSLGSEADSKSSDDDEGSSQHTNKKRSRRHRKKAKETVPPPGKRDRRAVLKGASSGEREKERETRDRDKDTRYSSLSTMPLQQQGDTQGSTPSDTPTRRTASDSVSRSPVTADLQDSHPPTRESTLEPRGLRKYSIASPEPVSERGSDMDKAQSFVTNSSQIPNLQPSPSAGGTQVVILEHLLAEEEGKDAEKEKTSHAEVRLLKTVSPLTVNAAVKDAPKQGIRSHLPAGGLLPVSLKNKEVVASEQVDLPGVQSMESCSESSAGGDERQFLSGLVSIEGESSESQGFEADAAAAAERQRREYEQRERAWREEVYRQLIQDMKYLTRTESEKHMIRARNALRALRALRKEYIESVSCGFKSAAGVLLDLTMRYSRLLNKETRSQLQDLQRTLYPTVLAAADMERGGNTELEGLILEAKQRQSRIEHIQGEVPKLDLSDPAIRRGTSASIKTPQPKRSPPATPRTEGAQVETEESPLTTHVPQEQQEPSRPHVSIRGKGTGGGCYRATPPPKEREGRLRVITKAKTPSRFVSKPKRIRPDEDNVNCSAKDETQPAEEASAEAEADRKTNRSGSQDVLAMVQEHAYPDKDKEPLPPSNPPNVPYLEDGAKALPGESAEDHGPSFPMAALALKGGRGQEKDLQNLVFARSLHTAEEIHEWEQWMETAWDNAKEALARDDFDRVEDIRDAFQLEERLLVRQLAKIEGTGLDISSSLTLKVITETIDLHIKKLQEMTHKIDVAKEEALERRIELEERKKREAAFDTITPAIMDAVPVYDSEDCATEEGEGERRDEERHRPPLCTPRWGEQGDNPSDEPPEGTEEEAPHPKPVPRAKRTVLERRGVDPVSHVVTNPTVAFIRGRAKRAQAKEITEVMRGVTRAAQGKAPLPRVRLTTESHSEAAELIADAVAGGQYRLALAFLRAARAKYPPEDWWLNPSIPDDSIALWERLVHEETSAPTVSSPSPIPFSEQSPSLPDADGTLVRVLNGPRGALLTGQKARATPDLGDMVVLQGIHWKRTRPYSAPREKRVPPVTQKFQGGPRARPPKGTPLRTEMREKQKQQMKAGGPFDEEEVCKVVQRLAFKAGEAHRRAAAEEAPLSADEVLDLSPGERYVARAAEHDDHPTDHQ